MTECLFATRRHIVDRGGAGGNRAPPANAVRRSIRAPHRDDLLSNFGSTLTERGRRAGGRDGEGARRISDRREMQADYAFVRSCSTLSTWATRNDVIFPICSGQALQPWRLAARGDRPISWDEQPVTAQRAVGVADIVTGAIAVVDAQIRRRRLRHRSPRARVTAERAPLLLTQDLEVDVGIAPSPFRRLGARADFTFPIPASKSEGADSLDLLISSTSREPLAADPRRVGELPALVILRGRLQSVGRRSRSRSSRHSACIVRRSPRSFVRPSLRTFRPRLRRTCSQIGLPSVGTAIHVRHFLERGFPVALLLSR